MTPTVEKTWKLLREAVSISQEQDSNIIFYEDKYDQYKDSFNKIYYRILDKYMKKEGVEYLDRHKVSAIAIICLIEVHAISYKKELKEDEFVFMANYILPLNVGLSYMLSCLNDVLEESKSPKCLEKYIFPDAMACPTSVLDIMARNLYYIDTNENWAFNHLDLAERLFWLECYSLQASGIDFKYVREVGNFAKNK